MTQIKGKPLIVVTIEDCPTCNGTGIMGSESAPMQMDMTSTCPTCLGRRKMLLDSGGVMVGIVYEPPAEPVAAPF
jgi:DnaJ-class molecular chaperone